MSRSASTQPPAQVVLYGGVSSVGYAISLSEDRSTQWYEVDPATSDDAYIFLKQVAPSTSGPTMSAEYTHQLTDKGLDPREYTPLAVSANNGHGQQLLSGYSANEWAVTFQRVAKSTPAASQAWPLFPPEYRYAYLDINGVSETELDMGGTAVVPVTRAGDNLVPLGTYRAEDPKYFDHQQIQTAFGRNGEVGGWVLNSVPTKQGIHSLNQARGAQNSQWLVCFHKSHNGSASASSTAVAGWVDALASPTVQQKAVMWKR